MQQLRTAIAATILFAGSFGSANAQLVFNNLVAPGTSPQALSGFLQAEARWSAVFTDNVTINLNIGTASLATGVIGSTGASRNSYLYSDVRNALIADSSSSTDAIAAAKATLIKSTATDLSSLSKS